MSDAADSVVSRPVRPALEQLRLDQEEHLKELRSGFPERRDLLLWMQKFSILSAGDLPDKAVRQLCSRRDWLAALLTDEEDERSVYYTGELGDDVASRMRQRLESGAVLPAFRTGYRQLRRRVKEIDPQDENYPEIEDQGYLAMRPAFDESIKKQRAVLKSLLNGFADRDAINSWSQRLVDATMGEVDASIAVDITESKALYRYMTGYGDTAERGREEFAARRVLPAFNAAARVLVEESGEYRTHPPSDPQRVDRAGGTP